MTDKQNALLKYREGVCGSLCANHAVWRVVCAVMSVPDVPASTEKKSRAVRCGSASLVRPRGSQRLLPDDSNSAMEA